MAIDRKKHSDEYKGIGGALKKFSDTPMNDGSTMKKALRKSFKDGAYLRDSDDMPWIVIPAAGAVVMALVGGVVHLTVEDHVDFDGLSESQYIYSQLAEPTPETYTILRSSDELPYLITTNDYGQITMYRAHHHGDSSAYGFARHDGWEWNVLNATDAYQALGDIITTAEEIQTAEQSRHLSTEGIFVNAYESIGVTVPYYEHDEVRVSSGEIVASVSLEVEALDVLDDNLEATQTAILDGHYRQYAQAEPENVGELDQSTLNPLHRNIALYSLGSLFGLMAASGTINTARTAAFRRKKKTQARGLKHGG